MWQILKCVIGKHSGLDISNWRSIPGAREVKICFHCGKRIAIRNVSTEQLNKKWTDKDCPDSGDGYQS